MVDASDLKSVDCYCRASSSLATPTTYLLQITMAKLTGYTYDGKGKREGVKFGAQTVRMLKRKRARKAEKEMEKRVSPHSGQAARGFA